MAYTPNPADPTQPVDTVIAATAAAEFRALKQYIQDVLQGSITLNTGTRNMLRNPAYLVNQRSATTVTADGGYFADGWHVRNTGTVRVAAARDFSALEIGYAAALISTTAPGAVAAGDVHGFYQRLEGYDWAQLRFGTANAKAITLSFDVQASVAGTYYVTVRSADVTRSYPASFVITSADTVEHKRITIPGDTAGAWLNGGVGAVTVEFVVGCGATHTAPAANVWHAGNFLSGPGQVQLGVAANYFRVWNLQLEAGSIETPFDVLSFSSELTRCQRYYETGRGRYDIITPAGGQQWIQSINYKVPKRAAPVVGYAVVATVNVATFDFLAFGLEMIAQRLVSTAGGACLWEGTWTADADL